MPGGKLQERRASRFSFFVYMTTRNGDPRARSRAWVFAFTEKMYRYTSPRQGSLDEKMYRYTSPRQGSLDKKMYRYTSPRQGSLDKQRLSSELDKLFISRHIRYIKNKKRGDAYVLHNENRKT